MENMTDKTERTRLLEAIASENVHWLLHILKETDLGQEDFDSALHAACRSGQSDCIVVLLAAGADMYSLNQHREHILLEVVNSSNVSALRAILDAGYDVKFMSGEPELPAPIHLAISGKQQPDYDMIELLIESGLDVESRDVDGDTALIAACNMGDIRLVKRLLLSKCNVNLPGYEGNTALHRAVEAGSADLVQLLLEHGADVHVENADGNTPLMVACENGHSTLVGLLLGISKPDLVANLVNKSKRNCFHLAALSGNVALIPLLANADVSMTELDAFGNSALITAVMTEKEEFALQLISILSKSANSGDFFNHQGKHGRSTLHWAALHGLVDITRVLVGEHRTLIKLDVQDDAGDTALILSTKSNSSDSSKLLIEQGCDVNIRGDLGRTALHWAVLAANNTLVDLLLSVKGINVNLVDSSGNTPLILAACNRKYDVMQLLLNCHTVDVNVKGDQGRTALHWVSKDASLEQIERLVTAAADVNVRDKNGESPLLMVMKLKHLPSIVRLLAVPSIDVRCSDNKGRQPLHYACSFGRLDVIQDLLGKGADVNGIEGTTGCSPLILAAKSQHDSLVTLLIEKSVKIDVNTVDQDSRTALFYAAQNGMEEAVKRLLETGADPEVVGSESSPLIQAAKTGNINIVEMLIGRGAAVNSRDGQGRTALIWAAQFGHLHIVERLMKAGADVRLEDGSGDTALTVSAWHGHLETLKLLLPASDLEHRETEEGMPVLHLAIAKENKEIVHELLMAGASVTSLDAKGNNALMTAMIHTSGSEIVSLLLEHSGSKIDVDHIGDQGRTALHWAVGDVECLKIILKRQPKLNLLDCNGASPLLLAIAHSKPESAELLINAGSDYNMVHKDGRAAIHHACIYGVWETVKLLLALGVPADTPTVDGKMPLLLASIEGHIDIVRMLIANGAEVNRTYLDALTALSAAAGGKHHEVMETLLEAGADPDRFGSRKCSPLMTCILNNDMKGILLLIQHGANVDQKIDDDKRPIHGAVVNSYMDILNLLVSIECDVNILRDLLKEGLVYYFVDDAPFLTLLTELSKSPKPLKMLCRSSIRRGLDFPVVSKIHTLPVPSIIKDYLAMKDLSLCNA